MNPVLFLDMDGVLNSAAYFEQSRKLREGKQAFTDENLHLMIDPEAVPRLNRIVAPCDGCPEALVVLSSSWRHGWSLDSVDRALKQRGFTGKMVDITPTLSLPPRPESGPDLAWLNRRETEIETWIAAQADPPTSIVCLDDWPFVGPLERRLVKTTWALGLVEEHVEAARALLRRPWPEMADRMPV